MAIEREIPHSPIAIEKFKPSQLTEEQFFKFGLTELIGKGYEYEGTDLEKIVRAASEYAERDERSSIYLALQDGRAIASLVTTKWTPDDENGKKFWSDLRQRNRSLHKRLSKLSPVGLDISGITTLPEFRRQGLAEKLYKYIIMESNPHPAFITGITKSPEAVMARAKHLGGLGYRTFFGNTEVTPNKADFYTNVHQELLDADIKARWNMLDATLDGTDVYVIDGWLPKVIPDTSNFPNHIQKAFEDIVQEQKKADEKGDKKVAVKALISITNKIRLRSPETEDENETSPEQITLLEI